MFRIAAVNRISVHFGWSRQRFFATAEPTVQQTIKYTDTINLPKTKFPQRLSAAKRQEVEKEISENKFNRLYQWQRKHLASSTEKEFVLHDGPPYANGELHMGHAINKILKDVILRQNIINGRRVHYRPGWDCHGLPIELKALTASEQKSPDAVQVRRKARDFALSTLDKQRSAFASWGITADWHGHIYRTCDADYVQNELKIFGDLYAKGLIYRDLKPVFWSPSSGTALAEAELEYDNNYVSPSLTLRIKIDQPSAALSAALSGRGSEVYALIWTTTPWSLPANQAICLNESLEYSLVTLENSTALHLVATSLIGQLPFGVAEIVATVKGSDLVGSKYRHPIDGTTTDHPLLAADHVQATKGTGLVHMAPAHGPDDFLVGLKHRMTLKCLVNDRGVYNDKAPEFLRNKSVLTDGNQLVLDALSENVVHLTQIQHSYPIDWRTKLPVLIRASDQWFIDTGKIKDAAIKEISNVSIYPQNTADTSKANLTTQLLRRPYWCISRQRSWGTPIPAFYNRHTGEPIVHAAIIAHISHLLAQPNASPDLWWTASVAELVPVSVLSELGLASSDDLRKGSDILDIWFDSGCSWSYALDADRVADLYLEGIDQFTGWFQSSLMTSVAVRAMAPYRSIFVHGFAVDESGLKMSKSLGNVTAPADVIKTYGTDAIRWWVTAHAAKHTAVPVSKSTLVGSTECVQKLRATLRYLVGAVGDVTTLTTPKTTHLRMVDKYFLNLLSTFRRDVEEAYGSHQYQRVTSLVVNFVNNDVSGFYVHLSKDRLYCGRRKEIDTVRSVLAATLNCINRAVWPITPFLVEECWSYLGKESAGAFYENVTDESTELLLAKYGNDDAAIKVIQECLQLRQWLNESRPETNTWALAVTIGCEHKAVQCLQQIHPMLMEPLEDSELCELLQVSSLCLVPDENCTSLAISTRSIDGQLCARCRRFAVPISGICGRCEQVLRERNC